MLCSCDAAYQRRVMLILNLREREPPIRAKATCGKPSTKLVV